MQVVDSRRDRDIEASVSEVGTDLSASFSALLGALRSGNQGPQSVAREVGVDKVLASRLLKAIRMKDPIAVVFHAPGPEPLRRFLRGARQKANAPAELLDPAGTAVDGLERLIREEAGDRSSLDAMISAWLPEARKDFELRRKQTLYKAMSHLKGMMAETTLATVILRPSGDGDTLDIVWILGLFGFQRLRPSVRAKLATRRLADLPEERLPRNLDGLPIRDVRDARVDEFCEVPVAALEAHRVGDAQQYFLGGEGFGPHSAADLVLVEVNRAEIPAWVPAGSGRKGNVFAEVATPSRTLLFDVLVHRDVYPGSDPQLVLYDTALDGVANVNDPTRDADRLDLMETVQPLARGAVIGRDTKVPRYAELLRHVLDRLGWDEGELRGYRCAIDYPLYGSQVVLAFDPPTREASGS